MPRGRGQKILVAEDSPQVLRLSVERLRDLGYTTLTAETADDALALLKTSPDISLLFTDLVMPGTMTGYDLAQLVRAEFPNVKILLTSGYSEDIFQQRPDEEASFDLIRKPYRQAELAQRLQALFSET